MMHGTRIPKPRKSSCGGEASSYQPPQSSQTITIAECCQYLLLPTALTTDATQDGPPSLSLPGWSEFCQSGMIHATLGKWSYFTSVSTCFSGVTMFFQSGPL